MTPSIEQRATRLIASLKGIGHPRCGSIRAAANKLANGDEARRSEGQVRRRGGRATGSLSLPFFTDIDEDEVAASCDAVARSEARLTGSAALTNPNNRQR